MARLVQWHQRMKMSRTKNAGQVATEFALGLAVIVFVFCAVMFGPHVWKGLAKMHSNIGERIAREGL